MQILPLAGLFGGRLLRFETLGSTNTWALEHAAECRHGDVVQAVRQTHGRGRFDRRWHGAAGRGLAVSVLLKPDDDPLAALAGQAAAIAVRRCAEGHGIAASLKWPNDVMVNDRKVAGILAERDATSGVVVVGIGLNVNLTAADLAVRLLLQPVTSMRRELARRLDPDAVLRALLVELEAALDRLRADGAAFVLREWKRADFLAGQSIAVSTTQGDVNGLYAGLDRQCRLRLRTPNGRVCRFWSGDVSIGAGGR